MKEELVVWRIIFSEITRCINRNNDMGKKNYLSTQPDSHISVGGVATDLCPQSGCWLKDSGFSAGSSPEFFMKEQNMNYIWSKIKGTKGRSGSSFITLYIFFFPISIYIFISSALSALVPLSSKKPNLERNNKLFTRADTFFYLPLICPICPRLSIGCLKIKKNVHSISNIEKNKKTKGQVENEGQFEK